MNDQQKIELLRKALVDAEARMTRARMILTDKNPRPECNWGMLDTTSVILPALSATATPPATSEAKAMLAYALENRLYVGWNREGDSCHLWKKGNPEDADEGCVAEDIRLPGSFDNEFDAIRAAMKALS